MPSAVHTEADSKVVPMPCWNAEAVRAHRSRPDMFPPPPPIPGIDIHPEIQREIASSADRHRIHEISRNMRPDHLRPKIPLATENYVGEPDTAETRLRLEQTRRNVERSLFERAQGMNEWNSHHVQYNEALNRVELWDGMYARLGTILVEKLEFKSSPYSYEIFRDLGNSLGGLDYASHQDHGFNHGYRAATKAVCTFKVHYYPHTPGFTIHNTQDPVKDFLQLHGASLLSNFMPAQQMVRMVPTEIPVARMRADAEISNEVIQTEQFEQRVMPQDFFLESFQTDYSARQGMVTSTFNFAYYPGDCGIVRQETTPEQIAANLIKKQMQRNMRAAYLSVKKSSSRTPIPMTAVQANEVKARETLRDMLTESDWRRYVTNGFIMVKAPSGLWYQVFRGDSHERMRVYKDNKPIESVCIHTTHECPPSDHVINMKILIELDEEAVRKGGNIRPYTPSANDALSNYEAMGGDIELAIFQGTQHMLRRNGTFAGTRTVPDILTSSTPNQLQKSTNSIAEIYKRLKVS